MIRRLLAWLERQPAGMSWVLTVVGVAGLGGLDYLSGFEVSFSFFYLGPVALAAWRLGSRAGSVTATVSTIAWMLSNALAGEQHANWWITGWNGLSRLGFFLVVSGLLAEMRSLLEGERRLARTDELTGLANRRAFLDGCGLELARARRTGGSVSLLFLDLDGFKEVNDRLGHAAGDALLRAASQAILRSTRGHDLAGRLGGDEFALLLPTAGAEVARAVVERLRTALRDALQGEAAQVTVSIGAVTYAEPPESTAAMLAEADGRLYEAKQGGRDLTVFRTVP